MFTPAPSEHELQAAGLTLEDLQGDGAEVWPENWQAFEIFSENQTQWRIGMNGPTGLDYNVIHHELDRIGLSREEYDVLKCDIRAMEFAALAAMSERE